MAASDHVIASSLVAAGAVAGALGTDVRSDWYRRLEKPPFQPPGPLFGLAWTVLYALVAVAAGRVLGRLPGRRRGGYLAALVTNLLVNAGWTWSFFRFRSTGAATLDALALQASNVALARRTARVDRPGALLLAPYLLWVGFACVLSGELHRRNH